jgi:hypothetical protein
MSSLAIPLGMLALAASPASAQEKRPNLQDPANPVPLMDIHKLVMTIGLGD